MGYKENYLRKMWDKKIGGENNQIAITLYLG